MATIEPGAVGDVPTNIADHSMTTTALSADIEILATFKDIVESTPVKAVFGSVIGILTLLGVRFLVLFPFLYPPTGSVIRTR